MVKRLLSSSSDEVKHNVRFLTPMMSQTSYSRHLSTRSQGRIIHVSIRPKSQQKSNVDVDLNKRDSPSETHSIQTSLNNERNDSIIFQRNHSELNTNRVNHYLRRNQII